MKFKQVLIAVTVLALSAVPAFAQEEVSTQVIELQQQSSYYQSFTGKVVSISDYGQVEGAKFVSLEGEGDSQANMIISQDTFISGGEIEIGAEITGYYETDAMMIMIYPPQYSVKVVTVGDPGINIKVDLFDSDLVSRDNMLKLNISDEGEVISQDGTVYEGSLENRKLVVYYSVVRESIPVQTTPERVVVLFDESADGGLEPKIEDVSEMDIVAGGNKVEGAAYLNEDVVMVPVRFVAEALGYDVAWEEETETVRIGLGVSFSIGKDYFVYMKTSPISLGTAAELKDSRTYVPLSFFTQVLKTGKAEITDNKIIIE